VPPTSDRLQILAPFPKWDGKDYENLPLLIKAKGKCTTDHISPAGPWLKYRGHLDNISNNMYLGAVNAFTGAPGKTTNVETGEEGTPAEIARQYMAKGQGWVFVGDQNVGEGSSREHAAMSPRWMGCRVAIARSFARIHHTNLKKQGILPMVFVNPADYDLIEATDRFAFHNLKDLAPGSIVTCTVTHADGSTVDIQLSQTFNNEQLLWFRQGSALNALKSKAA
jgi:aconitate hydratase